MPDQTARDPNFPVTCARCGGRISEPVAFCPHCGVHARFALAGDPPRASHSPRPRAASRRAEPSTRAYESSDFEGDLDPPWPGPPTPLFASPDGDPTGGPYGSPYGGLRAPAVRGARQWGMKGGTALILGAFVVIYGSAVLLHRYDRTSPPPIPQDRASKSVEGSIAPNGVDRAAGANVVLPSANRNGAAPVSNAGDSTAPDMSIASLPPPVASTRTQPAVVPDTAPSNAENGAAREPQPSGANDTGAQRAVHSPGAAPTGDDAGAPSADSKVARAKTQAQSQQKDAKDRRAAVAHTLDGVQARLAKNDLRGAHASLSRVLASDPRNGYALSLRQQLVSREQARDASLNAARACVVQSRWNCVWHNAGSALSVDASSTEAKALVDRAIIESGAATAPAGPGPDTVQVPMVQ